MSNETPKKSIKDKVLETIRNGEVKMHSRRHFILKTGLLITGCVLLFFSLLYLVSFIVFVTRQNGVWFVPIFGFRGLRSSFVSLPWFLILISILFIFILEFLVKRYSFAYKKPLLYSAGAIILFAVIGGGIVARTSFHRNLFQKAREDRLPITGPLYRQFSMPHSKDISQGTIEAITENGFVIMTPRGEKLNVAVTPETRLPYGFDFAEGNFVVVFGRREDGTIHALGVRKINDERQGNFRNPGIPRRFHHLSPF